MFKPSPLITISGLTDAVAIAVGGARACAVLADGGVQCWNATTKSTLPETVNGLTKAVAVVRKVAPNEGR
jgi:hypothetical protein